MLYMMKLLKCLMVPLLLLSPAAAQVDLSVSPPRLELTVPPGGTATGSVTLVNGGAAQAMAVVLEDFLLTPEGEALYLPAESLDSSLCPHLTVLPNAFSLAAGVSTEITVQVVLPPGAEGAYSCVAFFRTAPEPTAEGGVQLLFAGQVGLTVYATAAGSGRQEGLISELEATPETVRFVFENRGNTLLRPKGAVRVVSEDGEEVAQVPVDEFPLLPEGYREVQLELPELPRGRYAVFVLLDTGDLPFAAEGVLEVP